MKSQPRWSELLPPHDLEAEAALLGSIILDECRNVPDLKAQDFWKPAHAAIFDVLVELNGSADRADMVHIRSRLAAKQILADVGGVEYLMELAESVPSTTSMGYYAKLVHVASTKRKLMELSHTALIAAATGGDEPLEVIERLQADLVSLTADTGTHAIGPTIGASVQQVYDRLSRLAEGDEPAGAPLPTGIPDFDRMLGGGMQPGQLIIIAAATGGGKSALAGQIMMHLALKCSAPVAVFSLEMTRTQMAERMLAFESGVALNIIRGQQTPDGGAFGDLAEAVGRLAEAPIHPVDHRQLTPDRLRASARYLCDRFGVRAIVVDYLQLMRGTRRDSRYVEVSELSRAVKLLALEFEVPVLCLSQLNRESSRENRRPRLSDLRDSGSIEQDADVVAFLHDPNRQSESPAPGYEPDPRDLELILAKQRQGPSGAVWLRFDGATQRFKNIQMRVSPSVADAVRQRSHRT